jgi:hypothetical protein
MLSSRGLIASEPRKPVLDQLAGHQMAEIDLDWCDNSCGSFTVEDMRLWPSGLEPFYEDTVAKSGLTTAGPDSIGLLLIGAVLLAPRPLSLLCLSEILGVTWQQVRDELRCVGTLFPLEHSQRQAYLVHMGSNFDAHQHVFGTSSDRKASLSCALSTVTIYHKSVYDWYAHFHIKFTLIDCPFFRFLSPAAGSAQMVSAELHKWLAEKCWAALLLLTPPLLSYDLPLLRMDELFESHQATNPCEQGVSCIH